MKKKKDEELTQDSPQWPQDKQEKASEDKPKYFSTKVERYRRTK